MIVFEHVLSFNTITILPYIELTHIAKYYDVYYFNRIFYRFNIKHYSVKLIKKTRIAKYSYIFMVKINDSQFDVMTYINLNAEILFEINVDKTTTLAFDNVTFIPDY